MKKAIWLMLILTLPAVGAKKERDWKTARVLDSNTIQQSYVTGAVTNTSGAATTVGNSTTTGTSETSGSATSIGGGTVIGNASTSSTANTSSIGTTTGHATSTTTIQRVSIQTNELLLDGEGYFYIIQDGRVKSGPILPRAIANIKHGCRYVVGEDIEYSQDKGYLWVLDADGKECKVEILRQEKKQATAPR